MPETVPADARRFLPWVVAIVLFMETLDTTIVNTAVPSIAADLGVEPLSLKAVVASYILSLAVCIPISGWMADRFGTRRVFFSAVSIFTIASLLCAIAQNPPMLVAARLLQGVGAAMMMPVGRLTIIRTFSKAELLRTMNFVVMPALVGPLLGPTVGGLIVHFASWRYIFLINLPVGLFALAMIWRYLPDFKAEARRPLDAVGFVLFGSGIALLSWLLEIFGEHTLDSTSAIVLLVIALSLLGAYGLHASRMVHPLLQLGLFKVRTFRIAVAGGFVTRIGMSGMPFLLPLLYQLGMGLPAWQSGLLMMPQAAAAITMKSMTTRILGRLGYRGVLTINTVLIGLAIATFSLVGPDTPKPLIIALALCLGAFNSLQFTSMNTLAYADVDGPDTSMASTLASSIQQLSMSVGLATGSLAAAWFLDGVSQSNRPLVLTALHHAFLVLAIVTVVSSIVFWKLRPTDGDAISKGRVKVEEPSG
ncbi:DHA2 family efflux MFS transporter permease subunit [Caenimonas sp. SL110]|uniref:DHA2 family efflux MFS transporter permease subunit n=1 Tax=Caenimonas sp. SL110 TaxID=1450524 RepID=UPI0006534D8E|nr:DHA2 family efflux MFS transporter permease subunit [Caenimonas sp. SL110]